MVVSLSREQRYPTQAIPTSGPGLFGARPRYRRYPRDPPAVLVQGCSTSRVAHLAHGHLMHNNLNNRNTLDYCLSYQLLQRLKQGSRVYIHERRADHLN